MQSDTTQDLAGHNFMAATIPYVTNSDLDSWIA